MKQETRDVNGHGGREALRCCAGKVVLGLALLLVIVAVVIL